MKLIKLKKLIKEYINEAINETHPINQTADKVISELKQLKNMLHLYAKEHGIK